MRHFKPLVALWLGTVAAAEDWPEYRGKGRRGVWNESGILETFPTGGLRVRWRAPVRAGYAGPAVAGGQVFVTDYQRGVERVVCLDEETGREVWMREWEADYRGMEYASGPRATPTVDGERVYTLGAAGRLHCLDVKTGRVIWKKDFVKDHGTVVPVWGMACAPIVDGPRLIAVAGGRPDGMVVAFDKLTGREIWRALSGETEPGYSQPILMEAGGARQLIVWHTAAVASLDPDTGRVNWEHPFKIHMNSPIASPIWDRGYLMVSGFFNGSRMLRLRANKAELVWRGKSDSEVSSDGLHALIATPVMDGEHIYGICSYGQLRCLKLATGERVWETQAVTREKARNATAHIVRQGGRYFIQNDRGELIMAKLSPAGYEEMGRRQLIRPTSAPGARREMGAVVWSHPAFANRHVVARNDEEVVRVSLER